MPPKASRTAKKYSDLCKEFLIRQEKYLADIKKQLDPPHEELKNERLLAQWFYHPTADKLDWIITWFPGEKFFEDRKATHAPHQAPALPFEPSLTDDQLQALEDIQNATGEGDNPYWLNVIKTYPLTVVSMAAAETRLAKLEGTIIKNPGAHFVDTLKRLHEYRQRTQPPLP